MSVCHESFSTLSTVSVCTHLYMFWAVNAVFRGVLFRQRIHSMPVFPGAVKLSQFILCFLQCVLKLKSSQPFYGREFQGASFRAQKYL